MRDNVLQVLKATLAAAIFSFLCVLIFSFIIQLFSVSTDVIKPVNQVFKILAIALGGILFIRGGRGSSRARYTACVPSSLHICSFR